MLDYTASLENATTAGKLGLLLEAKRDDWFVTDDQLSYLEQLAPSHPGYIGRDQPSIFAPRWNLMVPEEFRSFLQVEL
jgi:hypothetical protein